MSALKTNPIHTDKFTLILGTNADKNKLKTKSWQKKFRGTKHQNIK